MKFGPGEVWVSTMCTNLFWLVVVLFVVVLKRTDGWQVNDFDQYALIVFRRNWIPVGLVEKSIVTLQYLWLVFCVYYFVKSGSKAVQNLKLSHWKAAFWQLSTNSSVRWIYHRNNFVRYNFRVLSVLTFQNIIQNGVGEENQTTRIVFQYCNN